MKLATTYLIGLVFGLGISFSGMSDPAKVLNFFDVAGAWDPSLAFVMGGALAVAFVGYRLVFGRARPLFDTAFHLPAGRNIDARLVGGSALFGVGWGVAGFCPGGALPALGSGRTEVFVFVAAMLAAMLVTRAVLARPRGAAASPAK